MRGMVGCNHIDTAIQHSLQNAFAIFSRFYCRIPFDEIAFAFVVSIAEPQVMHTGFGRDLFLSKGSGVIKKRRFPGGRNMQDMQA